MKDLHLALQLRTEGHRDQKLGYFVCEICVYKTHVYENDLDMIRALAQHSTFLNQNFEPGDHLKELFELVFLFLQLHLLFPLLLLLF